MNVLFRCVLSCLAAGWLAAGAARATEKTLPPPLAEAWQTLSIGFYSDASDQFVATAQSREAQLGRAIAQLNRPPVTPSSLEEAQRQLTSLAAGDDVTSHAARYFLGRLRQMHPMQPEPLAAAQEYERLVATGADDAWCRLALVKLAILRLTVLPATGALPAQLAAVEPLLARTSDPASQHDLHLVLAEARLNHEIYDAITLGHLRAAFATTREADTMRADLLVQIARLAGMLGDRATAREHYERFLRDYPKERRAFTVNAALNHLDGPFPP
jgi:tetratricopeptide (TPR) repeat protein